MTATKPLRDRTHTFIEVFKKLFQCHEGSTYNQGIHPKDASIINQAPTYRHRPPESVGCSRMAKPNKASEVKKKNLRLHEFCPATFLWPSLMTKDVPSRIFCCWRTFQDLSNFRGKLLPKMFDTNQYGAFGFSDVSLSNTSSSWILEAPL